MILADNADGFFNSKPGSRKIAAVDTDGFEKEMAIQKERSRAAAKTESGDWVILKDHVDNVEFVGYDELETISNIVKYREVKVKDKTLYQVVLDVTPFYGESGGQVGDGGYLEFEGQKYFIKDAKKENDLSVLFLDKNPSAITGPVKAERSAVKVIQLPPVEPVMPLPESLIPFSFPNVDRLVGTETPFTVKKAKSQSNSVSKFTCALKVAPAGKVTARVIL